MAYLKKKSSFLVTSTDLHVTLSPWLSLSMSEPEVKACLQEVIDIAKTHRQDQVLHGAFRHQKAQSTTAFLIMANIKEPQLEWGNVAVFADGLMKYLEETDKWEETRFFLDKGKEVSLAHGSLTKRALVLTTETEEQNF